MKYLAVSLLLCAFVATGFSAPVDEQLPPISLTPVNPIILNLAKETLIKVQDNLRSAGRVEEALHLNKLIDQTDKVLEKNQKGVLSAEQFDLDDHLDSIYNALEKHKKFLTVNPIDNKAQLIVPTNEELVEYVQAQLRVLITKLEERHEYARAKVLSWYADLLTKTAFNKDKWAAKKENLENLIIRIMEVIRRIAGEVGGIINPTTGASVPIENGHNVALASLSDGDMTRDLLDGIVQDLEKIYEGLKRDHEFFEAGKVKLLLEVTRQVMKNTHGGNANRKTVNYVFNKGTDTIIKHKKYLEKSRPFLGLASARGDGAGPFLFEEEEPSDEDLRLAEELENEEVKEKEDEEVKEKEEEEVKEKEDEEVEEKEDEEVKEKEDEEVKEKEDEEEVKEKEDEEVKEKEDEEVKEKEDEDEDEEEVKEKEDEDEEVKEKEDEEEVKEKEDEEVKEKEDEEVEEKEDEEEEKEKENKEHQPTEEEEKETQLSTLQRLRKNLVDLRDRLRQRRRNLIAMVVERQIMALDNVIVTLKNNHLRTETARGFIKHVTNLLERFSDVLKERIN